MRHRKLYSLVLVLACLAACDEQLSFDTHYVAGASGVAGIAISSGSGGSSPGQPGGVAGMEASGASGAAGVSGAGTPDDDDGECCR